MKSYVTRLYSINDTRGKFEIMFTIHQIWYTYLTKNLNIIFRVLQNLVVEN